MALASAAVACLALAALSLLVPSAPTTDPWGWIVWGREITERALDTSFDRSPSWKPLPVLATTPLSLAGAAAPALWLLVARAGALLSLVFAYRLAARLAGAAAGVLAAAALVLSAGWLRAVSHGYTEPLVIGLVLGAVERHLAQSRRQAFVLGGLAALARPELWPFLALYAVFLWVRPPRARALVAAVAVAVPVLWFVPDWIGSGDPFHGSQVASRVVSSEPLDALGGGAALVPLPFAIGAIAAVALAALRRDRVTLGLAGWAGAWAAGLFLAMLFGYPSSPRFFLLPAALVGTLGAVGLVRLVELPDGWGRRLAAAALLAALAAPFVVDRARSQSLDVRDAIERARLQGELRSALQRLPAPADGCGPPTIVRRTGWNRGAVAWELHVPLTRVQEMPHSAVDYAKQLADRPDEAGRIATDTVVVTARRERRRILVAPFAGARLELRGGVRRSEARTVAAAGRWEVVTLVPPNAPPRRGPLCSSTSRTRARVDGRAE
jgi:hypothetical protein